MRIAQESERVNGRVVVLIALLALAATVLGVFVAWELVAATRGSIQEAPGFRARRTGPPPVELNGIEMSPFPGRGRGPLGAEGAAEGAASDPVAPSATAPLERYGWADQTRSMVYIPIERAKELYLSRRARPMRAEAPRERGERP